MNCEETSNGESCLLLVEGGELHLLLSDFYAPSDHGTARDCTAATSRPVCEFLRTPRQGSGRSPQTSLCPGPADFCSCRTDDPPSPDPLEPLLMGGLARLTPANPPGPLLALFVEGGDVLLDPVGFGGFHRWDCQSGWPRLGWGICFCYSAPWGLRGPAVVSCSPGSSATESRKKSERSRKWTQWSCWSAFASLL